MTCEKPQSAREKVEIYYMMSVLFLIKSIMVKQFSDYLHKMFHVRKVL